MTTYAKHVSTKTTPQSQPILGKNQVENNAGGFVFKVDKWTRLTRFLVLGCEGSTYYQSERKLSVENAECVYECLANDPTRTINTIVDISVTGRAAKNDPAIFALAIAAAHPEPSVRKFALANLTNVCRIGTHLFSFLDSVKEFRGWGRSLKSAVAGWYTSKKEDPLALQLVKYQQRNGWSHRDALRLSKPRFDSEDRARNAAIRFAVGKSDEENVFDPKILQGFKLARKSQSENQIAELISEHSLPRECVPTEFLNSPVVWESLLPHMGMTALVRNLGKMSSVGLLRPMSSACQLVVKKLTDTQEIKKSRIHPFQILLALTTYSAGCGVKGSLAWDPDSSIVSALNSAFYLAFSNVEPTGKRFLIALDVSGSMSSKIMNTHLSARDAAAAIAMQTVKTEPLTHTVAFTSGASGNHWRRDAVLKPLDFSDCTSIQDAVRVTQCLPFGGTDCSLPMQHALKNSIDVDVFVVITDSETWAGEIHPCQALQKYRRQTGINAKLAVIGMTSTDFSIADPSDSGTMDFVGFDANAPLILSQFAKGEL